MDYRSPLDNVLNLLSGLPHGHDKPVKQALYNALALFALILCCAATYALYVILEPFIKPLVWALLVGSVLHPFKCSLAKWFRSWFDTMEESRTPIFIGIFIVPVNILNDLSEFIGSSLLKYLKYIVAVGIAIPLLHVTYYYTPRICICLTWKLAVYSHALISFIINNATIASISLILIGYISVMIVMWSPKNNKRFHCAAIAVWLLLSCFLAHQCGASFQTPVFVAVQIIFLAGFAYEVYDIHEEMVAEGQHISVMECLRWAIQAQNPADVKPAEVTLSEEILGKKEHSLLDKSVIEPEAEPEIEANSEIEIKSETLISEPVDLPTKHKSGIKFYEVAKADAAITNQATGVSTLPSTPKKKDPWSLELFEEQDPYVTRKHKNGEDEVSAETLQHRSGTSNASLLITDRGKIHVIKQPSQVSPTLSEIFQRKPQRDPTLLKFRRSHSQPAVNTGSSRSNLFKFRQKLNPIRSSIGTHQIISTRYASDFYLYTLLWGCGIMLFWKNMMMLPILVIPILIYIIKHVGIYLGLWNWLSGYFTKICDAVSNWCYERYDALVPVPIRGLCKVMHKANVNVKRNVKDSIDTVASCVVILGLLVFVICASIFIAIQIYAEAIMLVQMTSNVINQTVVHNPELRQLLPPSFDDTVDSILDNAYQYGREGISKVVPTTLSITFKLLKAAELYFVKNVCSTEVYRKTFGEILTVHFHFLVKTINMMLVVTVFIIIYCAKWYTSQNNSNPKIYLKPCSTVRKLSKLQKK